jgi:hypothetical protein
LLPSGVLDGLAASAMTTSSVFSAFSLPAALASPISFS